MFDLLIKGGTLLDPRQALHAPSDVAFAGGRVAAVAPAIPRDQAHEVIEAAGRIVTPGWIDLHVHVFPGVSHYGIRPDPTCLAHGATTVVDAGSSGADTFAGFREYVIETSATRIFALLNISSQGMLAREIGELDDLKWANVGKALQTIERNRDRILGVKVRLTRDQIVGKDAGLQPLFLAREAADAAGVPLMVHPQRSWASSVDQVLDVLRAGDIMTHLYHGLEHGILDDEGKVRGHVRSARERGVLFDVGHGEGSFSWSVAETALAQDFPPTTISSDLHRYNLHGPVYDLATTVSKFLHLGVPLEEALSMVTAVPARVIGQPDALGTLAVGASGDAVVCELEEGRFPLLDSAGDERQGRWRLLPRAVIRAGRQYHQGSGPGGASLAR